MRQIEIKNRAYSSKEKKLEKIRKVFDRNERAKSEKNFRSERFLNCTKVAMVFKEFLVHLNLILFH